MTAGEEEVENMMENSDEHSICNKNCSTDNMDVLKSTTDTDTNTDKMKMKYDNLTDVDVNKCVNNQNICNNNNLKNAKIIHDTDCNVVIENDNDNDDEHSQTKQLQQQQSSVKQPPLELPPTQPPPSPTLPQQQQQQSTYGCKHYKRKAKFVVSTNTFKFTMQTNKFIRFKFHLCERNISFWFVLIQHPMKNSYVWLEIEKSTP